MRARLLVVTAVAAERDAVAAGLAVHGPAAPGGQPLATVIAAGVGPAAAAAATTAELAAAARPLAAHPAHISARPPAAHPEQSVAPAHPAGADATAHTPAAAGDAPGPYTLVVSAGIGGGFAPAAPVGSTAVASAIVAADLGAQTPEGFASVTDLGFGTIRHLPPPALARRVADALGAAYGPVLTVSTVTGTAERAAELAARHPGAVAEAMEGFGVAEAAVRAGVPVLEIRAVSNPVGPRDRAAWRIGEALAALTTAFGKLPRALEV